MRPERIEVRLLDGTVIRQGRAFRESYFGLNPMLRAVRWVGFEAKLFIPPRDRMWCVVETLL